MKLNYIKGDSTYSLDLVTVKPEGSALALRYNNKIYYTPVTSEYFSNSTDIKFQHNGEILSMGFADMTIGSDNQNGDYIVNYNVSSTITGSNRDDTLYINGDYVSIDPQIGNDIININADFVTLCASDDNKFTSYRGSNGVIEFANSDSTINYGDYKIDFKNGTDFDTSIDGGDVLFYNETDTLRVINALGESITVTNYNGIEETVLPFSRDINSMLTYDSVKKAVTLNGSAQETLSGKKLFEGNLNSGNYLTSVITLTAVDGANNNKGIYIEGNSKANRIIIEAAGDHSINGGVGNDTISLYGGNSNDVIVCRPSQGNDIVHNFNSNQDKIQFLDFVEGKTNFKITIDSDNNVIMTVGSGSITLIDPLANTEKAEISIVGGDNREIKSVSGYVFTDTYIAQHGYITLRSSATGYVIQPGDKYIDATAANEQLTFDATQANRVFLIEGFKDIDKLIGFDTSRLSEASYEEGIITLGLDGKKFVLQTVSSNALDLNGSTIHVDENMLMNNSTPTNSNNFLLAGKNEGFNSSDYGINHAVTINGANTTGDISISGSTGNELIIGGTGSDTLTGGDGSDIFVINVVNDNIITDLEPAQDQISLKPIDISDLSDINVADGNVTLKFPEGSLVLQDLSLPTSVTINNESFTFGEGTLFNLNTGEVTFYYPITLNVASDTIYSGYSIFNASAGGSLKADSAIVTLKGTNVTLDGDSADDTFVIGGAYNMIKNFTSETDQISLSSNSMDNISDLTFTEDGLELTFSNDEKLFLENLSEGATATIDGSLYLFEEGRIMNISTGAVTFLTPVYINLGTDAIYSHATYLNARGGGSIKAGTNAVTLTGAEVTLEGGTNSDTFVYNGNDITIKSYAENDRISLAPGYTFNAKTDFDYDHDTSKLILTIKDTQDNEGNITFENLAKGILIEYWQTPKKSTVPVSQSADFTVDYIFNNTIHSSATGVTVCCHVGDFGAFDENETETQTIPGTEYFSNLASITAAKENSTLTGCKNNNFIIAKGGDSNVMTGGIGNDTFIFKSGGGLIKDFGSGCVKTVDKKTLAGLPTATGYNRTDPSTYKEGVDVLQVYGKVEKIVFDNYGADNSTSNKTPDFEAYVIYTADADGEKYVIKLDNIYKTVANYVSKTYRTDEVVAKAFNIWDTNNDKGVLARRKDVANILSTIENSPYKNLIEKFESMFT